MNLNIKCSGQCKSRVKKFLKKNKKLKGIHIENTGTCTNIKFEAVSSFTRVKNEMSWLYQH